MATVSTGLATSFINFSRPGATGGGATVTDRDGKIKWAGHNLLTNSESFDASAWAKEYTTVDANVTAAPNGTSTADLLKNTTANAVHGTYFTLTGVDASIGLRLSCFVKKNTVRYVALGIWNASGTAECGAGFDLDTATGAAGAVGAGYSASNPSITSVGSNWYLISVTVVTPVTTNYPTIINRSTSYSSGRISEVYTGSTSESTYLWGAHLYRSDMQMQLNPAQPAGMQSYYPTTPRNLLGFTEDFSNAAWTKNAIAAFGSGSVSNAAVAPNGLQTADKLVEAATSDVHVAYFSATGIASGTSYTLSVYAKADTRSHVMLRAGGGGFTTAPAVRAQLSGAGSVTTLEGAVTASSITAVGDGWYRVSMTFTTISASGNLPQVGPHNGGSSITYTGDGTSGIYLWGAQLSDSASLDTYVPVYGAAVTSAAYYAPRLDFNGATLAARGLLVEEQRTNLIQRSEEFENAYWTRQGVPTITANSVISPSGLQTADTIAGAGTAYCGVYKHATSTNGSTYTSSVYVKANTASFVIILVNNGNVAVWFNLSTGAKGTVVGSAVASDIVPVGNGWYRVYVTAVATGVSHATVWVAPASADNVDNTTGSIYAWGAQVELGAFPTSYVPNVDTVAGVTRAADVASVSTGAFPYSESNGTWVAAFQTLYTGTAPLTAHLINLDASGSKRVLYFGAGSDAIASYDGTTILTATGDVTGSVAKSASAYTAAERAVVSNGGTVTTGSTVAGYSTASIAYLGSNSAVSLNGWVRQITYLPRRISNAELISRTS